MTRVREAEGVWYGTKVWHEKKMHIEGKGGQVFKGRMEELWVSVMNNHTQGKRWHKRKTKRRI